MIDAAERDGVLSPAEPWSSRLREHRHRPGDGGGAARLPGDRGDARQDEPGEDRHTSPSAPRWWSARPTSHPTPPLLLPGRRPADRGDRRGLPAEPVLQRGKPRGSLPLHRARDLAADVRPDHPFRCRRRDRGHDQRRRPLPQGAESRIEVVGADPEGSLYSGGPLHPYRVEGIGEDFWPDTLHRDVVDRYIRVSDRDSFIAARRLVAREGLFAGGSSEPRSAPPCGWRASSTILGRWW